jgi:multiple sugar transport system ATP-binding protein
MSRVRFQDVSHTYEGAGQPAVEGVTLDIADGELFVLLGPSGCGKSSLLKLIAGLEEPDEGAIRLDDDLVNFTSPGSRNVAMVFQNYALYPHMTVRDNVRFPLRMLRTPRAEADDAVRGAARALELEPLLDRPVGQLSGGQRQRVAVARAIVRQPRVMLMDEPLSNLDALLRMQTREELLRLHRRVPGTIVYVTHDQVEAMTMGDRIGVMHAGRLVQVGTPEEIYTAPADRFVAGFIGTPPMSFLEGVVRDEGDSVAVDGVALQLAPRHAAAVSPRDSVVVGVRPEAVRITDDGGAWVIDAIEDHGHERIVGLRHGERLVRARVHGSARPGAGRTVGIGVDPGDLHVFGADGRNVVSGSPHVAV